MAVKIVLAGHGSGKPSTKGLSAYCASRYAQNKGLVEVRRFSNLTEAQRQQMHDVYKEIIGRNLYNQALRSYCYIPYKGKYYSDCSSSICRTAEKVGIPGVASLNTAGMHYHLEKVENVIIEEGLIKNPEVLLVGDALMFKGTDPSRPLQIGHTEMVYEINGMLKNDEKSNSENNENTMKNTSEHSDYIKTGQMSLNNFINAGLIIDGIVGRLTKTAVIKAIQTALNLDYKLNLDVDGILGIKTKSALEKCIICVGDRGYMITVLEILLHLNGYNPNGIEYPGIFESGCRKAVYSYQKNNALQVDCIVGKKTLSSLLKLCNF